MKRRGVLLLGLWLLAVITLTSGLLPSIAQAGQTELTPVACKEGVIREPITLKYGEYTTGCQIDTITDMDRFSFYGQKGEEAVLSLMWTGDSTNRLLSITIVAPDGAIVVKESTDYWTDNWGNYYGYHWQKLLSLTMAGTYVVLIEEEGHDDTAQYQLSLERVPPAFSYPSLTYFQAVQDSIDHLADMDFFAIQGTAGSNLQVLVSWLSDSQNSLMNVEIRDPQGVAVFNKNSDYWTDNWGNYYAGNMLIELPITVTGRHLLIIREDDGSSTFDYQIELQCISGTCVNLQPQPDVEGCLRERGEPVAGVKVKLKQAGEPDKFKKTDANGCYKFPSVVADLPYTVSVTDMVDGE
jgi:hypothetical protein